MSKLTKLMLGTIATVSLVTGSAVGTLLMTGNRVTDPAVNTAPSDVYGTGSYLSYQQTIFTGTGGQPTYIVASIGLPSNYGSGGYLHRAHIECDDGATGSSTINIEGGIVSAVTSSGSGVFPDELVGTGATLVFIESGAGSGVSANTKWPSGHFLNITATSDVTGFDCMLKVWTSEQYQP